jgi:hypothetical protein
MKMLTSHLLLVSTLALVSCAAPMPEKRNVRPNGEDGNPKFNVEAEITKAQETLASLKLDWLEKNKTLIKLQEVNRGLCKRLAEYRTKCAPTARILAAASDKALECQDNYEDGTSLTHQFTVKANAPMGNKLFHLVADGNYESSTFADGTDGALKWAKSGDKATLAPKLRALKTMRIKAAEGVMPPVSAMNFEVRLNNALLFDQTSIVPPADQQGVQFYDLKLDKVELLKKTADCMLSDEDLDAVVKKALEDVAPTVDNLEDETFGQLPEGSTLNEKTTLLALQNVITASEAKLGELALKNGREDDRNGKLNKELMSDASVGCFAEQPINTVEIVIGGAHLAIDPKISYSKQKRPDDSFAKQLNFSFGGDLKHPHLDEEANKIIGGAPLKIDTWGQYKVKDIEFINIEKMGIGWESVYNEWPTWGGLGKGSEWQNHERFMYQMTSVDIKINGQLFYSRTGLNHILRTGSLKWSDQNLMMNRAYRTLMNRTDVCSAK